MSLRRRLETSKLLIGFFGRLLAGYLRLCRATTRWTIEGQDALEQDLAKGPVLLVMWHERSFMGAAHWPVAAGQLSSLHATSPIGQVSGAVQRRLGLRPMAMDERASNMRAARVVLARVKDGVSIGMTGDGPLGPARQVKDAPLDWARAAGVPVWGYAFACTGGRRLDTWDNMILPRPFGRGHVVFARWEHEMPRKPDAAQTEAARQAMAAFLDGISARADQP